MDHLRFLPSLVFTFALTVLAAAQIGYARPVALQSCSVPGVKRSVRCGDIEVPENPDQPGGRKLQIHSAVISAADGTPAWTPLSRYSVDRVNLPSRQVNISCTV